MNRRGRSLNRFYPDDCGKTCKDQDTHGWIPLSRPHTRGRSLSQLSPGDAGKGYQINDGHVRSSYQSRDFDEDEDSYRKSYQDYLKKHHKSNYDRRIGYEKTYDERYKDRGQDGDRRKLSLKSDWFVDHKKASREGELLFYYEKWMSDKGWIRTYEGDWERSRIEHNGFRWEKAMYYEKYREWECEDNDWRETNRGRSRYRTRSINPRSYGYMPRPKENWYKYKKQDSFIECQRSSSANHSLVGQRNRYSIPDKFISRVSSCTKYSPNERDRSSLKRVSRQMKRSNSRENSSNRERPFTPNNNCSTSDEGQKSASQFQEYHSVESETARKNGGNSSFESGEITDSSRRSQPRRTSESSQRLKSQIGLISSGRLRRPREKRCGIQRPCDFYQKGTCKFPSWHNDRSGCCRLHVCAFCFSQDYDLKRGTPVLNLHMEKNCPRKIANLHMEKKCPRYIANVKLKRSKLRTKSLDRCHGNKGEKCLDNVPKYVINPRSKSLDRRFGKHGKSNKPKLDIEMSNIEITVYNNLSKDENAKNYFDPRKDYLEDNVQSKKVTTGNTINLKVKMEESTDSETDGSESFSDTDNESKESTDDSRKSSEESDATTSESHDSDRQDRIKLLKAVIKDLSKINEVSKIEDAFQKHNKERAHVLVSGLSPEVSQDDIYNLFSTVGKLEGAKLLGNGKAEVVFTKNGHALLATKKFDNKCLDGKLINCSLKASSPVNKEGQSQSEENHSIKEKGKECSSQMLPLRKNPKAKNTITCEHATEKNISFPKDENNVNMEVSEKKEALNEGDDVKNSNKVHEDTIDLNISQDLFESASSRYLAPAEKMQESD